ncbi:hypothetical protein [Okeania sp. SIO1I7]|uniref:hypothetical protein n=1 Tax=Okeania sp. SIO1I7 TaxID=2607772 RepID=UPI0013F94ED0|nr:hypothetical protein [Okeania sp. SIO1I7]NET29516.1 hypothetical protein [Okeania sp. SIO1I7]
MVENLENDAGQKSQKTGNFFKHLEKAEEKARQACIDALAIQIYKDIAVQVYHGCRGSEPVMPIEASGELFKQLEDAAHFAFMAAEKFVEVRGD